MAEQKLKEIQNEAFKEEKEILARAESFLSNLQIDIQSKKKKSIYSIKNPFDDCLTFIESAAVLEKLYVIRKSELHAIMLALDKIPYKHNFELHNSEHGFISSSSLFFRMTFKTKSEIKTANELRIIVDLDSTLERYILFKYDENEKKYQDDCVIVDYTTLQDEKDDVDDEDDKEEEIKE